jgi:hypothetical protein
MTEETEKDMRSSILTGQSPRRMLLTILSAAICHLAMMAQSVESSISSMEMKVGEQVALTITAHAKDTARVDFPASLLLPTDIEVLEAIQEPEVDEGGGMKRHSVSYVLTSFRDTLYPLPPVKVLISGKEYATKQLALKVYSVDVDTTNVEQYYGPKAVQDMDFNWTKDEMRKPFIVSWIVVLLVLAEILLTIRLLSNKPIRMRIKIIKHIPPHQKAMKAINEIKADNVASADNPKEYYTRLTDTLRQYIYERYGFNAMEMTSSEIIEKLTSTDDPKKLEELRQLFITADLVKFAKYSTLLGENDTNLVNAVEFINQTKQENVPTEEIVKPQLTYEQKQTRQQRKVLKIAIGIIGVVLAALLAYVAWFMYDIFWY